MMRSVAPPLLPIFRSQHQAELLSWLLLHTGEEYTVSDLAHRLEVPLTTLHREIVRLDAAELLVSRQQGRNRLVRANPEHPAAQALARLLEISFGPRTVVAKEFADLGARLVLIFGSWAARYEGIPGPPPGDVDVLVVGSVDRTDVYDAADRAQSRLGVPVNPVIRSPEQWDDETDQLVAQITSSPHVVVIGSSPGGSAAEVGR